MALHLQTAAGADFIARLEGVGGGAVAQLAVADVTALRQEVERRQRSEDRLQLALAASATGVWKWTLATPGPGAAPSPRSRRPW